MKKMLVFIVICLVFGCKKADKSTQNLDMKEVVLAEPPPMDKSKTPPPPPQPFKTQTTSAMQNKAAESATLADNVVSTTDARIPSSPQQIIIPSSTYSTPFRKIIRTAQIKSQVENTEKATYRIEQIARKSNGFTVVTHLENRTIEKSETLISKDSTLEIAKFEVVNTLSLRIPNDSLDTFLTELSRIYTHLDYRRVNGDDVTARFLTDQLKAQLRENSAQRIAQAEDEKGKRLNNITNAEEVRVMMKDEAIEQQIQNLETDYDIAFSVVNLEIYQPALVSKTMKPSVESLKTTANFGFRLTEALANGWSIVLEVFLFFVNLWVFILMAFGIVFGYRKLKQLNYLPVKS